MHELDGQGEEGDKSESSLKTSPSGAGQDCLQ